MNHSTTDRDAYLQLGKSLNEQHSNQLSTQLQVFQSALINFANDHGDEISSNLEFKNKFTQIVQSIGIDPLDLLLYTSQNNNNSTNKRSNVVTTNFGVALAVKIIEICQQTRDLNGGLISLKELISTLQSSCETEGISLIISEEDIETSLNNLNSLGKGYEILIINGKKWLKFSSTENLSNDQLKIYELCEFMGGYVTYRLLRDNYGWDKVRCKTVIDEMIMNGFLWVDSQDNGEWQYWEPSWISN
ncbi:vacuolar-sorting protein, putative [Candida dubliniensis CD36]|uniref:Vacuolar-sorting protein SNF8 n=1 Tax=Candida dubliniensis (strain CD36 / ATCC MYA-646 / CBS 7987 / NCPF 3949 / NRRL Y-17841) TaxID=573826 RepID=B9WH15_CANDC|nr:vacuolar-sorting protein, putative [Candida dubliniensis CD36]CAX41456.1 vacuolar-sorting protein, putative [Candida dubliniensis CD36]